MPKKHEKNSLWQLEFIPAHMKKQLSLMAENVKEKLFSANANFTPRPFISAYKFLATHFAAKIL